MALICELDEQWSFVGSLARKTICFSR
ncbi:Transposase [Shigella dysenteriae 1617]|uniref:Transposase n=1 Tax=Shigella dysenteriae 1617 TaxID=754093 RepID=A0A0A7A3D4_SHIDY|nr:Transposase [Shigella dysenteriae 1617]AHA68685.1 Transposase [Shigella dysenteriae 1617]